MDITLNCPWCGKDFSLAEASSSIKERHYPKWWQHSHENSGRRCPHCGIRIRIKPGSVTILWLTLPFFGVALWGSLSGSPLEWVGWIGAIVVLVIASRMVRVEKVDGI